MAKQNFKNKVLGFLVKAVFGGVLKAVLLVFFMVLCLVAVAASPVWFPVCVLINAEECAFQINAHPEKKCSNWAYICMYLTCMAAVRSVGWLNKPFIAMLPMKYRREFILQGSKPLCDYSTMTQVRYYKTFIGEGKSNLIACSNLSEEARDAIWADKDERQYWVLSGRELADEQVKDLVLEGKSALLWSYFKKNTPSQQRMYELIKYAREGYESAQNVLIKLIKQQRPDHKLVARLLMTGQTEFTNRVQEVIDEYADMDAVNDGPSVFDDLSEEEKEKKAAERWYNFCKAKKNIDSAAQKKMSHKQFKVFAETGHQLEYNALLHLLLNIDDEEYLRDIIVAEFEQIETGNLVAALKADYWRYSTYLAEKRERAAKA